MSIIKKRKTKKLIKQDHRYQIEIPEIELRIGDQVFYQPSTVLMVKSEPSKATSKIKTAIIEYFRRSKGSPTLLFKHMQLFLQQWFFENYNPIITNLETNGKIVMSNPSPISVDGIFYRSEKYPDDITKKKVMPDQQLVHYDSCNIPLRSALLKISRQKNRGCIIDLERHCQQEEKRHLKQMRELLYRQDDNRIANMSW